MASPLAVGAGANEGLDEMLSRMMAEERLRQQSTALDESTRHNRAEEGIQNRNLDQNETLRQSLQDERQAKIDAAAQAAKDEAVRKGKEQEFINDPNVPNSTRLFMRARGAVQKGEQVPYQLFQNPGDNVHSEQKTYKLTDPNLAAQFGKKPGDVIDADYNPGSNKISYRGVDVTSGVDHYEKPPAPDRVLIQTGDGYMRRPDAASKLQGGGEVPLATTGSTRTMQEGAQMLRPHIGKLAQRAQQLDQAGMFGPVMSRVRGYMTKWGSMLNSQNPDEAAKAWEGMGNDISNDPELNKDRLAGAFATSLGLMLSGAGRVHGGARGGGSIQMLEHFKTLFSDNSTLPMFLGRLDALDEYMGAYADGPQGPNKPAETGGLPTVGGTFNGGKVLKVTPVK